jgi:uncharacterized protein YyaL (SSP411 family)
MIELLRLAKNHHLHRTSHLKRIIADRCELVGAVPAPEQSLENTMKWIRASFKATNDGGSSAYYLLGQGWKASYPETTGYIIPTLYEYAKFSGQTEYATLARKAADWLLSIQHVSGGWQGLQVDETCDLRIFNSGMIIDGMIEAFRVENDPKYLESARRCIHWILGKLDNSGFFSEFNVVSGGSFDTLVCACLMVGIQYLPEGEARAASAKVRNALDAHLTLQTENGWFRRCNFIDNDLALLHHIGYTVDGLLISAEILEEEKYYKAARKTLGRLLSKFEVNLELPAFIKSDWSTHKDLGEKATLCLTGYSQVSIAFQKVAEIENDLRFLNAALKINDLVAAIGNYSSSEPGINYGLAGSYPLFGSYQPFQFVNWAAKYHCEALMKSLNASYSKKKSK